MPVRDTQPDTRQGSESSGNSWISQDTVRNPGQSRDEVSASSGGRNVDPFPGSLSGNPK